MTTRIITLFVSLLIASVAWAQPVLVPATTATVPLPTAVQGRTILVQGVTGKAIYVTVIALIAEGNGATFQWFEGVTGGVNCSLR